VGPFPLDWLAESPGFIRRLPHAWRTRFSQRCLRAAAAAWLTPRMGAVRVNSGRAVTVVREKNGGLQLRLHDGSLSFADHVLLATGYAPDIAKPGILGPALLERIRLHPRSGCPVLGAHYESSVPGLHFAGSSSVPSYGPLMRFVAGAGYAARSIARGALSRNS